jgi:AcrR family transcriptional regulator
MHPTAQKILDEAVRMIDERGESGVRIMDLQSEVDVSAPSIYHFFRNREGLVREAQLVRLRRTFEVNSELLDTALDAVSSAEQLRQALTDFLTEFFAPERAVERRRRAAALGSFEGRPELSEQFAEVVASYVEERALRLEPFQSKGWIRADLDLRAFTYWLIGFVFGRFYVEVGHDSVSYPEWDAIAEKAAAHILFGTD